MTYVLTCLLVCTDDVPVYIVFAINVFCKLLLCSLMGREFTA